MADIDFGNMTSEQMFEEVNKAIVTVMVGGQSYKIGSRSLTRADLGTLKSLRDKFAAEAAQDNGLIGSTYVAQFEGR